MSSTTESVESVQSLEIAVDLETVLAALTEFDCADLFKVIKTATLEAEKRVKSGSKIVAKKAGSAPKGVQPPQLRKPRRWVEVTLEDALANGWEEFTARKEFRPALSCAAGRLRPLVRVPKSPYESLMEGRRARSTAVTAARTTPPMCFPSRTKRGEKPAAT